MSSSGSSSGSESDSSSSSSGSSSSSSSSPDSRSERGGEGKGGEKDDTVRASSRSVGDKGETKKSKEVSLDKLLSKTDNKVQVSKLIEAEKLKRGGVYLPPFRLRQLIKEAKKEAATQEKLDKDSSVEYQKMTWMMLRKNINGLVNKVNVNNMKDVLPELFELNLVRGRGLLARSIMKAQLASPTFTHIYAALVAVINTKLPENGRLVLCRVIIQFRRAFKRNDKLVATALVRFIAQLVNQRVAHEILALEVIQLLLSNPTNASVEVAIEFTKEVGMLLDQVVSKGLHAIFETFREILQTGKNIDKRVQYRIDDLFMIRRDKFANYPTVTPELDLVELEDQITHQIGLDEALDKEEILDVFRLDPKYTENNRLWSQIRKEILGIEDDSDSDSSDSSSSGSSSDSGTEGDDEGEKQAAEGEMKQFEQSGIQIKEGAIKDLTEAELVQLRRVIYLTIMSSLDFEECVHKLLKINIPNGLEHELVNMMIECCSQERTFVRFYGLLAQRFCVLDRKYLAVFETSFKQQYSTIHRLETNQLRNVAKLFAHLLQTEVISWKVLECFHLNEDETTSSSRIFAKLLLQDLSESLGVEKLRKRLLEDPELKEPLAEMFPMGDPKKTRFAINFFTLIGLGKLTDDMRDYLKTAPKVAPVAVPRARSVSSSSGSDSDSSSSSSSSSSSGSSGSSRSTRPRDRKRRRRPTSESSSNTDEENMVRRKPTTDGKPRGRHEARRRSRSNTSSRSRSRSRRRSPPRRSRSLSRGRSRSRARSQSRERSRSRSSRRARNRTERAHSRERSLSPKRRSRSRSSSAGPRNGRNRRLGRRRSGSSSSGRSRSRKSKSSRHYSSRSSSRSASSGRERRLARRKKRRLMRSRSRS